MSYEPYYVRECRSPGFLKTEAYIVNLSSGPLSIFAETTPVQAKPSAASHAFWLPTWMPVLEGVEFRLKVWSYGFGACRSECKV